MGTPDGFEKYRFVSAFSDNAHNYMSYTPTVQRISERLLL